MTTEAPPDLALDPVEAYHECNRRMRKIRDLLERRRVVEASARDQLGEITAWRDQELGGLDAEIERLRMEMRPVVAMLVHDEPRGKKSVNLVAGVAGFRAGRERVVVEDEEAALSFLAGQGGPSCTRITRSVDIPAVKRLYPQPDVIPGIRVEKGDDVFYTEPITKPEVAL